ncbi:MAG: SPOR domain-containing protein [Thiobacillaceae bacterium]|jgi:cell division protein FtsN
MARSSSSSNGNTRFWGGFSLGLIFGLALALVVALVVTKNNPFVSGPTQITLSPVRHQQSDKPVSPAEAPTYDFYKSLPSGTNTGPANAIEPQQAVSAPQLWLQAGAFQHSEEADNMKAKLALLGVEANIESADIPDKGTLYRVRVGPMKNPEELEATRKRLMDNSIPAEPVGK